MKNKGQVTIFIIIAIFIISITALFFVFKDSIIKDRIPSEISPIYSTLVSCLENDLSLGVNVLESQGGYIYIPEYESGSDYMPFSSQLDFLGNPVPYWYYVSGNNIEREQVPSINDMQNQLEIFVEEKAKTCLFDNYYSQGYEIMISEPNANVEINANDVILDLTMDFSVLIGEDSYLVKKHKITLNSELGALYNSALKVYNKEQEKLFLEEYALDTLRLYAPVDGVEMTCSPKIWNANDIFDELQSAIEANTLALKRSNTKKEYFDVEIANIPSKQNIRFLNSPNWAYSFEVLPSEESIMVANPVGNQQGLGILGFCYVPYHFVYNIKYPVLVQVSSGEEIFQFPLAVIVQRNKPREFFGGEAIGTTEGELCKDKNVLTNIRVYDSNLRPLDAYISYECLGTKCNIGTANKGVLYKEFPQCVNGKIIARAEGYEETSVIYSTVEEGSASIYLTKLYDKNILLKVDGQNYNRKAIIYFVSGDTSRTVLYPEQKSVKLGEGEYEVQVYIYKNSSLELGASKQQQCVEVPRSSIGGMLGLTKEECFDVEIPAQIVSSALSGGGKANYTFSENSLKSSNTINIDAESLPSPNSLEQLQTNYVLFESKSLDIEIK
jgi:hypothetical protein